MNPDKYSLPDRVMQAVTLGSNCGEAEEERTVENHHDTRPMDCSGFSETAEIGIRQPAKGEFRMWFFRHRT